MLERAGVDRGALADASSRAPVRFLVGRLIVECVAASACPTSACSLASARAPPQPASLAIFSGMRSRYMRHCACSSHTCTCTDRGGVVALNLHGAEDVELSYLIHHPNTPGTAQILDAEHRHRLFRHEVPLRRPMGPIRGHVVPRPAATGGTVPLVLSGTDQVRRPSLSVDLSRTLSRSARRGRRPGHKNPLAGARG